ncbi:MAG: aldolase [Clostridia bacterium]|nr:aldolase [Clostridia bacterium]
MAITLMYITNRPDVAKIAQDAGVDRVWVDLEYKGKEERQAGMNTVKSKHTVEDVKALRAVIDKSSLMVRVNPLDDESEDEINKVIEAGADYIMLPMFKTKAEVERFISLVGGRAKTMLLLETKEAEECIEEYVGLPGIDEIHIGLNDLHLAHKMTFMFELVANGTVERLANILKAHNVRFGFGGFARIGYGILPAEMILTQHYALGSEMAILSRGFCDANAKENIDEVRADFIEGVNNIRLKEKEILSYSKAQFENNFEGIKEKVSQIVESIRSKK